MSFYKQSNQQTLACLLASKPAEADLCTVTRGPISFVPVPSDTFDLLPSEAELILYYEAYNYDLRVGPNLLQLHVRPSPNVRR